MSRVLMIGSKRRLGVEEIDINKKYLDKKDCVVYLKYENIVLNNIKLFLDQHFEIFVIDNIKNEYDLDLKQREPLASYLMGKSTFVVENLKTEYNPFLFENAYFSVYIAINSLSFDKNAELLSTLQGSFIDSCIGKLVYSKTHASIYPYSSSAYQNSQDNYNRRVYRPERGDEISVVITYHTEICRFIKLFGKMIIFKNEEERYIYSRHSKRTYTNNKDDYPEKPSLIPNIEIINNSIIKINGEEFNDIPKKYIQLIKCFPYGTKDPCSFNDFRINYYKYYLKKTPEAYVNINVYDYKNINKNINVFAKIIANKTGIIAKKLVTAGIKNGFKLHANVVFKKVNYVAL
ncbi:MAG: hypothetical protein LHV68_08705 [Elusimicrobia bacterium]|nr:hypothetical protein [Candidatus Liberimonas magnetica]